MADNYRHFSEEILNLTEQEERWFRRTLSDKGWAKFFADHYPKGTDMWMPDFSWDIVTETDGSHSWWVYYANIDQVVDVVQEFLRKFRPDACFRLEYADTCSKPRVGEFGDGAVLVTAVGADWMNTGDWLSRQLEAFELHRKLTDIKKKEKKKKR